MSPPRTHRVSSAASTQRRRRIGPRLGLAVGIPLVIGCAGPLPELPTDLGEPVADAARPVQPGAAWLPDAVGYEVFVRSFADSNGDGQGDLAGITARLPYLQELGVDLLWLTPIHPSPSYHGYDVSDYEQVHKDFGTLADFDGLLREAHGRGMRVLLDLVANHTAKTHPWFTAAQASPAGSATARRYLFRSGDPGWQWLGHGVFRPVDGQSGRYYLGLFSGAMPDLNLRDDDTLAEVAGVMTRWLARGVDGFRLDAARYLVEWPDPVTATTAPAFADTAETHRVWQTLRERTRPAAPGSVLVGEVWTDLDAIARYHGEGRELDGAFNFPLAGAMVDGLRRGTGRPIRDVLENISRSPTPAGFFAPFLTNHDQRRLASELGSDGSKLRLAATLLLSMPGTPFLYYGEEIGLAQSDTAGDRGQRPPMPWATVEAQRKDAPSLWRLYQRLIALRRATPALRSAGLRVLFPRTSDDTVLVFSRGPAVSGPPLVAAFNLSATAKTGVEVALPTGVPLGPWRDLLREGAVPEVTDTNRDRYPLPTLPPWGAAWLVPQAR